tara:strand:- start:82 stop:219 length:138 start_codon:yes stop_codon:yes gene_type:complete
MKPDIVNPIAPKSEENKDVFSALGRGKKSFKFKNIRMPIIIHAKR